MDASSQSKGESSTEARPTLKGARASVLPGEGGDAGDRDDGGECLCRGSRLPQQSAFREE